MGGKSFINDDFLLQNSFAKKLYHDFAKDLPIIDYHNHLSPEMIAGNYQFANITEAWLAGDHYKWRAMRTMGIPEKFITGDGANKDKFLKWASIVPYTIRNPLYHWTHLELKRYFNIDSSLDIYNAAEIFEGTSHILQQQSHSAVGLLSQMKVEIVCTTDDPADSLEHHRAAKHKIKELKVLPAFRPDRAYATQDIASYQRYLDTLSDAAGLQITSFEELLAALENRIDYFHEHGCRLADHGLENLHYYETGKWNANTIFKNLKDNKSIALEEASYFKSEILKYLCKCYHKKGWVQQFHLGALRNNNRRMLRQLGPDSGFDSISDLPQARSLSNFMDHLDTTNQLAKTILYNLNPSDNELMASMIGNFNDGSIKGKVQWGSAWWFLDQKDGMERHLNTLSNIGLLSCFVGMLTDSRSFLSFPRHEYFRRILCNLLGSDVARGELPEDETWLGKIVQDICYQNAKDYFPF